MNFTAIDFETAHPSHWSICQIGLVEYNNGKIIKEMEILVQPPGNFYWETFTYIHGIHSETTQQAPTFDKVWPLIKSAIENKLLVAHNGSTFDFLVLRKTLQFYNLDEPFYHPFCTYKLYKEGLKTLCDKYNIPLNHHHALSDAKACADLFLLHLESQKVAV